jgi:hypothetical protein
MHKISKSLVLATLLSHGGVKALNYDLKEGHCPYKAGDIVSKVKDTLDTHKLMGPWMNIYDRKVVHEHKCYGINLIHTHGFDE